MTEIEEMMMRRDDLLKALDDEADWGPRDDIARQIDQLEEQIDVLLDLEERGLL